MKSICRTITRHLAVLTAAALLFSAPAGCAHAAGWNWLPGVPDREAESYYRFMRACYEEIGNNPKGALTFMKEAYELSGKSYYLRLEVARLYSLNGEHQNGLKYADDAIATEPENPKGYFLAAMIAARSGLWDQAEKYYKDILRQDSKNADAYMFLGALYKETEQTDQAEAIYRKWTTVDPGFLSYYYLGNFYNETGRTKEAIIALGNSIKKDPEFITAHLELAQIYEAAGDVPGQEKSYRALIKLLPDENKLRIRLGLLYLEAGRKAEADKAFREAGAASEDPVKTHLQIGQIHIERESYKEAGREFEAALKIDPDNDQALYLLSWILLKQSSEAKTRGSKELADRAHKLLKDISPESDIYTDACLMLVASLDNGGAEGRVEESLRLINEAVEIRPDEPRLRVAQAMLLEESGEVEKARDVMLKAARMFPEADEIAEIRFRLGLFEDKLGNKTAALAAMKEAARLAPDDIRPQVAEAMIVVEAGDLKKARDMMLEVSKNFPAEPEVKFRVAIIEDRMGDKVAAMARLREAIALDPDHAEALNNLAYTMAERRENLKEALEMALKADRLKPNAGHILDTVGWIYFQLGQTKKALEYLRRAVPLSSQDPVVMDHLGDILLKQGRKKEALEAFNQALDNGFPDKEALNEKINKLK